ncbi:MAG: hypothetical protein IPO65_04450 [Saprospiraceae bacterium]|nr:hypothetical protein [Saprospiraceae bacterium]
MVVGLGIQGNELNAQNCNCPSNLVLNPSFEGNVNNWSSSPAGTFTHGSGFEQCGYYNAFLNATNATANFWQQVNGITAGQSLTLTFYAGTHVPTYDHQVRLRFYNSANAVLQTNSKQIDFDVDGQGGALEFYTITASAPTGTSYIRVEGYANGDYIKIDQVCLTTSCSNVTSGGTIGSNQSACASSFDPAPLTSIAAPSGGSGTIEYLWLKSTSTCTPPNGSNNSQWQEIPNSNSATYDPPSLTQTTCFLRCSRRVGCTNYDGESNIVSITLSPAPYPEFAGTTTICNGNSTTLTVTGKNGVGPYTFSWSNGLGTGSTKTVNPTTTTTYTVIVTDVNGCTGSGQVTVTVNQCACVKNYIVNHSFENGTNNWTKSGGNFTTGSYAAVEGVNAGHFQITNSGSNWLSQSVPYQFAPGSAFTMTVYAGTHNPSLNHQVCIDYFDANWNWIDNDCVEVNSLLPTMTQYSVSGIMPANGKYVGVAASGNGDWIKTDVWCLTGPCYNVYADLTGTNRVCAGGSTTISATGKGGVGPYTFAWSNGLGSGSSKSVSPATTTTYTVTTTDASGCSGTSQFTVTVDPLPVLTAGNDVSICNGQSVTLTVSASNGTPAYTFAWSTPPGGTGTSKTVNPTTNTTYVITVTDSKGCTDTDDVMVSVGGSASASITGPNSVCLGSSITLTASGAGTGGSYAWSNGATTSSITISPTTTTSYTVTVSNSSGCTGTASKSVSVVPAATVNVGPDKTMCQGDELVVNASVTGIPSCGTQGTSDCNHTLAAQSGWLETPSASTVCGDNAGTKLWTQSGQGTSSITLDLGSVLPAGTVICVNMKLEHCNGSSSSNSDAKIQASLSSGTGFVNLTASVTFAANTYHEYCYTLASDARFIKVSDNGKCAFRVDYVKATTPGTYNNAVTYAWSGPGIVGATNGSSITVNASGTYTLVVTDCGGCTSSDAMVVTYNNPITAEAGADKNICAGQSATLTATTVTGATYEWRENGSSTVLSTSQSFSVTPTSTKSYILTVKKDGCEDSDDVTVNVYPGVTATITGPSNVCQGGSLTLTAGGGGTYAWSNGSTQSSITVTVTANTTYSVTVTDVNGCTDTESKAVTIIPTPTVNVGADITLCQGDEEMIHSTVTGIPSCGTQGTSDCNHTLSGQGGWLETPNASTVCGDNAGTKLWTSSGQGTSFITLNFGTLVPAGTQICVKVKLEHCNGSSSTQSDMKIQSSATSGGTYTDVVASKLFSNNTYQTFCYTLGAASQYIKISDNGKCAFRVDFVEFTTPNSFNNSVTYAWSGPGIVGATNGESITVNASGTYTLVVTDCNGCSASDQVNVTYNNPFTANAGADKNVCAGQSATLTATSVTGATYEWRENGSSTVLSTSQSFSVTPTSTKSYILTVKKNGCEDSDDVTVNVYPSPTATITGPANVCQGGSLTLTAGGGGTYAWSNGSTQSSITVTVTANTTYSVTVTDVNGCTDTESKAVTIIPTPTVNVGADITLCQGDEEMIHSTVTGIPSCGTQGTSDCNHTLSGQGGWLETPNASTVCGDNAGTKLWTSSGQGTSFITLNFGTLVPAGTQICVKVKLEHCNGSSSTQSDMKIQSSATSGGTYTNVVASKLFSNNTYQTFCYTLGAASQYIKISDNGKCAFRVDFVEFTTPNSFNNSVTYAWSGPGIVGATNGESITVNASGTYTLVVTDCNGCSASDQVNVTYNNPFTADAGADKNVCAGQSATLTATSVTGATYEWRENGSSTVLSTSQSFSVTPTSTKSYILTVKKNGCEDSDDVTVNVYPNQLQMLDPMQKFVLVQVQFLQHKEVEEHQLILISGAMAQQQLV